jgi:hypothetical protein
MSKKGSDSNPASSLGKLCQKKTFEQEQNVLLQSILLQGGLARG